jgi:hypothetical protein
MEMRIPLLEVLAKREGSAEPSSDTVPNISK